MIKRACCARFVHVTSIPKELDPIPTPVQEIAQDVKSRHRAFECAERGNRFGAARADVVAREVQLLHLGHLALTQRITQSRRTHVTQVVTADQNFGHRGSLTSINLAGNHLGVEGAKALVEGGAFMGSLTRLDVTRNNMEEEGKAALRKAIEVRSGFELKL